MSAHRSIRRFCRRTPVFLRPLLSTIGSWCYEFFSVHRHAGVGVSLYVYGSFAGFDKILVYRIFGCCAILITPIVMVF